MNKTPAEMQAIVSRCFDAIQNGRADANTWVEAGVRLIQLGEVRLLTDVVTLSDKISEPAPILFNNICAEFRKAGDINTIPGVIDQLPETLLLKCIGYYYCGCALVSGHYFSEALPWFKKFRDALPPSALALPGIFPDQINPLLAEGRWDEAATALDKFCRQTATARHDYPFIWDDYLNIILRQGRLILLPSEILELRNIQPTPLIGDFRIVQSIDSPRDPKPIFFISADEIYIKTYFSDFIAALATHRAPLTLHVNIIDPASDTVAWLLTTARAYPHLRIEVSTVRARLRSNTVFACARLAILPEILRHSAVPVIAVDIDVEVKPELIALSNRDIQQRCDFSVFETGRDEPASVYQASIMVLAPTQAAMTLLDDLNRICSYFGGQIPRISWMTDQAALFSALETHRQTGSPLRFETLNSWLGCGLGDVVSPIRLKGDNKWDLRGHLKNFAVLPALETESDQ